MKLADLKRLKKGSILTLINTNLNDHKFLNVPREIDIKQSHSIRFKGGSWLDYPSAKHFKPIDENCFSIIYPECFLTYFIKKSVI